MNKRKEIRAAAAASAAASAAAAQPTTPGAIVSSSTVADGARAAGSSSRITERRLVVRLGFAAGVMVLEAGLVFFGMPVEATLGFVGAAGYVALQLAKGAED